MASTMPKVKQCQFTDDQQFGSTATSNGEGRWLVANPVHGGHWVTDDDVKDWADITSPKPVDPAQPPKSSTPVPPDPSSIVESPSAP